MRPSVSQLATLLLLLSLPPPSRGGEGGVAYVRCGRGGGERAGRKRRKGRRERTGVRRDEESSNVLGSVLPFFRPCSCSCSPPPPPLLCPSFLPLLPSLSLARMPPARCQFSTTTSLGLIYREQVFGLEGGGVRPLLFPLTNHVRMVESINY